jgi:amino acid transporter
VLAPVYIFYGFESAGDVSEETKDAGRQVPKAMRYAMIWGGLASLILTAALILAIPGGKDGFSSVVTGGVPAIFAQLPSWLQDIALLLVIFAFFSCGTSVQGAGARLAFSYARDGALPGAQWISAVHPRFKTPVNALLGGAVVTMLFVLLEFISPSHVVHILWFDYPANTNALVSLVSFATSGIYLSFFLTVVGAAIARARGNRLAPARRRREARRGQVAAKSEQSGSVRTKAADSPSRHRLRHGGEPPFPLVLAGAPVAVIRARACLRARSPVRADSGS